MNLSRPLTSDSGGSQIKSELRHGFKKEAEQTALEVREELRLSPVARLDPWLLATHLDIEVTGISEIGADAPLAVRQFSQTDPQAFSAVTVFRGSIREIVHNDFHLPGRRASNVTHELSHGLLLHPPAPALDELGCRDWDPVLEAEADWLAGVLLITEAAALSIARRGITDEQAAEEYGVSLRMATWRMNATAARRRIERSRHYRRLTSQA